MSEATESDALRAAFHMSEAPGYDALQAVFHIPEAPEYDAGGVLCVFIPLMRRAYSRKTSVSSVHRALEIADSFATDAKTASFSRLLRRKTLFIAPLLLRFSPCGRKKSHFFRPYSISDSRAVSFFVLLTSEHPEKALLFLRSLLAGAKNPLVFRPHSISDSRAVSFFGSVYVRTP